MSAFFKEILQRRNEIEQEEQLRQRVRYQIFYRQERSRLGRANARENFDADMLPILQSFCQNVYPSMSVRIFEQGWSIGRWARAADGSQLWESIFDITLRYDSQDRPVNLECRGHNRRIVAEPTSFALRQTLVRFIRPRQPSAPARMSRNRK